MKVLVTGADGFIGRNLGVRLGELGTYEVLPVTRATPASELRALASRAGAVVHLAGVNRPPDVSHFVAGNRDFTRSLLEAIGPRAVPVVFSSSTQAEKDNPYGRSKREAEELLEARARELPAAVTVLRLPNVFGKWSRPDYNSAVATFCYRIARGQPIDVHDPAAPMRLMYIDDVVELIIRQLQDATPGVRRPEMPVVYDTTVGEVAEQIRSFAQGRESLVADRVGVGLTRALYATYVSFLPPEAFSYPVPAHADPRGVFVEMLKTRDSGQFSFFTAHPGVTRGGHYHHTKTEKFLVIKGRARFRFRELGTNAYHELETSGDEPRIVDTIPGWSHDITNVGQEELVVMLWANEVFDRARPDTVASRV